MKFKKVAIITGVCMMTTVLYACTTGGRTANPRNQGTNEQLLRVTPDPYIGQRLNINPGINDTEIGATPDANGTNMNTTPGIINTELQSTSDNPRRAEDIKNQLTTMKEVKQVNVFVIGNAALVGYSPTNPSQDINTIKNMIINKVKETDKNITNITVSESADVMGRISNLTTDMTNNRPINEITNDFNKIIQSIAPMNR